jgi:hypothetical protein
MKLCKLLESHTEIDTAAVLAAAVDRQTAKFKNIKNLTYGPGTVVESINLNCSYEESQRRMTELDKRISEVIMKFNMELLDQSRSIKSAGTKLMCLML